MCRNIKILYNFEPPTTEDEVQAAAVQFVRKVSGMNKPSQANEAAFERAIAAVAAATRQLLDDLVTTAPPRDREEERALARPVRPEQERGRCDDRNADQESDPARAGATETERVQKRVRRVAARRDELGHARQQPRVVPQPVEPDQSPRAECCDRA